MSLDPPFCARKVGLRAQCDIISLPTNYYIERSLDKHEKWNAGKGHPAILQPFHALTMTRSFRCPVTASI